MSETFFHTITEQVAELLRTQIRQGQLSGLMPGRNQLAASLGINAKTVEDALHMLEKEGVVKSCGAGHNRQIVPPPKGAVISRLRLGLLLWAKSDKTWPHIVELQHRLVNDGHKVIVPKKTLMDMKMDVKRIARVVEQIEADAWVVSSGSLEVLEWFVQQEFPTFALYGRYQGLPIAAVGSVKKPAVVAVTKSLIEVGHRHIVMLVGRQHRLPQPGPSATAFLDTLASHGIVNSPFWLPDWEESKNGFQECLKSIFQMTPPSAIIFDESANFTAAYHFLANRGLRVPQDVSLVCLQEVHDTEWCVPAITHIRSDLSKVNRPVLRWAQNVSRGNKDIRQTAINMEYVPGGTAGRAPTPRVGGPVLNHYPCL